jgi:hypothetical protein
MAHSPSEQQQQQQQHHHPTPIPYSNFPSNIPSNPASNSPYNFPTSNSPYSPPSPLADDTTNQHSSTTTHDLLKAAQFMSQDSDRRVFHRFDSLRLFVLLRQQHRLAALATELESLSRVQEERARKSHVDGGVDADAEDEDVGGRLEALVGRIGPALKDFGSYFLFLERFCVFIYSFII